MGAFACAGPPSAGTNGGIDTGTTGTLRAVTYHESDHRQTGSFVSDILTTAIGVIVGALCFLAGYTLGRTSPRRGADQ